MVGKRAWGWALMGHCAIPCTHLHKASERTVLTDRRPRRPRRRLLNSTAYLAGSVSQVVFLCQIDHVL